MNIPIPTPRGIYYVEVMSWSVETGEDTVEDST